MKSVCLKYRQSHQSTSAQECSVQTNRFGGYYQPGNAYSPTRLAGCLDSCHVLAHKNDQEPTVIEFMESAKIGSKDLARKIIDSLKHDTDMPYLERGHRREGAFYIIDTCLELQIELHHLCLY